VNVVIYKTDENNFDLIRLFAATQVAALHSLSYLSHDNYGSSSALGSAVITLLEIFPGVPIFFFISGLLISRSYEKNASTLNYTRNRALRIFPALHVCVAINLLMIWATGYFHEKGAGFPDIALLYLSKTSFAQFYNPDFMRDFGDGVLNGSLWTISVELQFYFLVPVIYYLLSRIPTVGFNTAIVFGIVFSLACNRFLYAFESKYGDFIFWKLGRISFLPWFYMFLAGVFVQRNFAFLSKFLRGVFFPCALLAYVLYATVMRQLGFSFHNDISPVLVLPLFALILLAAYSAPTMARNLLGGNDISYGIYIYHLPFINMLLHYSCKGSVLYSSIAFLLTLMAATLSWRFIEMPFLKKKRQSPHPVTVVNSRVS
jgi:peptidoglycan/LPS O-acetylase OafA/YrhL